MPEEQNNDHQHTPREEMKKKLIRLFIGIVILLGYCIAAWIVFWGDPTSIRIALLPVCIIYLIYVYLVAKK